MRTQNRQRAFVVLGATVVVGVTLTMGLLEWRLRQGTITSAGWVSHTLEVERELHGLLSAVTEAETGQRGFLLIQSETYLSPYRTAIEMIPLQFNTLRRMTTDSPAQRLRIEELHQLTDAKLAELKETVDLATSGRREAALSIVASNRGRDLMDRVRQTIHQAIAEEERLLGSRTVALQTAIDRGAYLMWALIAANVGALAAILSTLSRLQRLRSFVTMCAWSKTIKDDDEWVTFEQYLDRRFNIRVSHGLSPAEELKLQTQLAALSANAGRDT